MGAGGDGQRVLLGGWVGGVLPEGQFQSLIVNGVIAGVGGVLVFLPPICILFFCFSILEDTGYLPRAASVAEPWVGPGGLPGQAFWPLFSRPALAAPPATAPLSRPGHETPTPPRTITLPPDSP